MDVENLFLLELWVQSGGDFEIEIADEESVVGQRLHEKMITILIS